ncbi:hypothetical protein AVEN_149526-1 [Araneus ventricosus]|uniref:Uncharacterized protein n=1 Tax=Araneus ventricosus TaxID=182803 RepID=A0A4Y2K5Q6_ARAVE|nr:hypothetical protein AVEN_149526-1 [Araneus ventricosus]
MSAVPRDLSPLMRWFRNKLLGREFKNSLRFQDFVATSTESKALVGKKVGQITPGNPYVWHEAPESASTA